MVGRTNVHAQLWYQGVVRVFANCLVLALCAACGQSAPPASTGSPEPARSPQPVEVTPANVIRVRAQVPAGYEVADLPGPIGAGHPVGFRDGVDGRAAAVRWAR
jgi:hypothetical protein